MSEQPILPADYETVSAAELRRNFGVWQERASSKPVVVARHGKPKLVLTSANAYLAARTVPTPTPDDLAESAIATIPEHSSEALLVLDHQLTILAVNRVFEDMVGRHASRLVGHSWAEVFPKTADSVVGAQLRHVLRTGAAVQFEAPSAVIEGRHYAFTAYPHEHGVAALIVNRTAEFALRDQLEEYRGVAATFALLGDAAYVRLNLRGFVEGGSPQVAQLLGIDPKARPHTPFADLLEPDCRVATLERLDVILAGGEASRAPAILRGRDGRVIPVSLAIAPIWRGPAADGAVAFFHLERS